MLHTTSSGTQDKKILLIIRASTIGDLTILQFTPGIYMEKFTLGFTKGNKA
jgi:hypothetical protein